jgi:glycosyltransferase involved in cell wall biosynthesis
MSERVLHVFKYFRPRFTGEGIFVERLALVFARLRPDVRHDILVTETPSPADPVTPEGLAAVHYLAGSAGGGSQRDLVAWLARNGRRYRVVHYHTHVDRTFLGAIGLKLQGCRLVLSATLDDSVEGLLATYRPVFRPLVRRLFGVIDRFVAISPKLFHETNRFVSPTKSSLVPIGIPLPADDPDGRHAAREALAIPAAATVMVSVGGVCARKDQMFLVRQLAELAAQDPSVLLILVGPILEADYHARIEQFVADHGLHRNVRFAGYAETPWDFYKAADLMVFASREEGFGTVVIEAMAHRLPVVARRLPGVNDAFVDQGRTGYLFDQTDEFRAQVGELLRDPELRRAVGGAAHDYVAAHFDIEKIAARYLDLYGFAVQGAA